MTLTPRDFALASIAAPEPESRLTSRITFAPLVIACSACCCWVDLSPCAFWIVTGTPAAVNAFCSSGRSTVSQRTEDFVSGSSTATLPALPPPPPPDEPPPDELLLLLPQPATTSAPATVRTGMSRRAPVMSLLLQGDGLGVIRPACRSPASSGTLGRPPRRRARVRRAPGPGRRGRRP